MHSRHIMLALVASTALAACGGSSSSSSSGGGGPAPLTEQQQAALAALSGASSAGMAQDMAGDTGYDDDEENGSGLSALTVPLTTGGSASLMLDCSDGSNHEDPEPVEGWSGEGAIHGWSTDDGDADPDIHHDGSPFSGSEASLTAILTEGTAAEVFDGSLGTADIYQFQQRADCSFSIGELNQSFRGAMDLIEAENIGGVSNTSASYAIIGGLDGADSGLAASNSTQPDITESFTSGGNGGAIVRGVILSCTGCPHGDLDMFEDDIRNSAFHGMLEVDATFDVPDGDTISIEMLVGELFNPMSMTTVYDDAKEATHVLLNGRIKLVDSANEQCSFDVNYAMGPSEGLYVEDYETEGSGSLQDGSFMTVTFNDTDTSYDVRVEDGQTEVRLAGSGDEAWEVVTLPDEDIGCGEAPESNDDTTGDSSELANNTWQTSCIQTDQSEWERHTWSFTDTHVTFSAELHDNDSCTSQIDAAAAFLEYETRPSGTEGETEIDFTDTDTATVTYDLFAIVGDNLYFGTEGASPPNIESNRPNSVDTSSEWAFAKQ